jgi:ATP-dependent RNA helicase SUPV3L1/SUV3
LAREVYDRIVAKVGPSVVALVTGEERIVPDRTQYWVCTTEAMPLDIGADFVCVDEIQLCADPDRGHVFTDRLLRARGLHETLFLGSDTMRGAIAGLVPKVTFTRRDRFSTLSYAGSKKISRMPPRSAIVGFSVENVYAIAELIRRQKGRLRGGHGGLVPPHPQCPGRAVPERRRRLPGRDRCHRHGAEPRHQACRLFVHREIRRPPDAPAYPQETGQIAGRAGRHTEDGTFGVTGEARPFDESLVEEIETHRFAPVKKLMWRNSDLDFTSAEHLIASLEAADLRRMAEPRARCR